MTGGAVPRGDGRMLNLFCEFVPRVADKTEVSAFCRQEFQRLMFCGMRVRMTGDTPPGFHDRVHIRAFGLFPVTTVTKRLGLGVGSG